MDLVQNLREVVIQGGRGSSPKLQHPFANEVLSFSELIVVLDELAEIDARSLSVRFTGFDLGSRSLRLLEYGRARGLHPVIEISPRQPILSGRLEALAKIDPAAVSFALEDVSPALHNAASHDETWHSTIYGIMWARDLGLPVEVRTIARPDLLHRIGAMQKLVGRIGGRRWVIDLLGSPAVRSGLLRSAEVEDAFTALVESADDVAPSLEVREGPSFRRSMLERSRRGQEREALTEAMKRIEVWNSRGQLFIGRQGVVTPSRTLPIPVGDVRNNDLQSLLVSSSLLRAINDPTRLGGKCGPCALGGICGGSRARAWRINRDPLSSDPGCPWTPEAVKAGIDAARAGFLMQPQLESAS